MLRNTFRRKADDPRAVMDAFIRSLRRKPEFFTSGEPIDSPMLNMLLRHVGQALLGCPVRLANAMLFRLPDDSFIHGIFTLNDRLANVIYFEDIAGGIVGLVENDITHFVRFMGGSAPAPAAPTPMGGPHVN